MTHTLVTFLGRGRSGAQQGYSQATYQFPDGRQHRTSFFGLALAGHLRPDRIVILGTCGSTWGVLVEHVVAEGKAGGQEEARIALMDAEVNASVDQTLLDRVTSVVQQAGQPEIVPQLIPFGRTDREQHDILETIAKRVERGEASFDLTHGFRHMGVVGMLSAFMLERIGHLKVRSLWYGALEMTAGGVTPVLRLDGLHAIQRWVSALDRFDASGDYGVFAPLLEADGVPSDKTRCLEEAAFFERTLNLSDAARKLRTFLEATEAPLPGASGLFQAKLRDRLGWVRGADLAAWQSWLARQYLGRGDFVRASVFAWEALVSRECTGFEWRWTERQAAVEALDEKFNAPGCDMARWQAFRTIRTLRNALAHGNPPANRHFLALLAAPEDLRQALQSAVNLLLP